MLSCLVVQPFLLAMPADIRLAIKAKNNCYSLLGFYCSARFKHSVYYSCKIFPSLPPSGDNRGLGFVLWYAINKLGTLLGGEVKSAQPLPPSLLAALPFNISCKPILLKVHLSHLDMCGWAVNTSNSGSGGLWFKVTHCIVSLDKELYSTWPLFTQVYKWA